MTFTRSILRKWLLTRHNTNHCCDSGTLMTHLWSGLMAQSSYRISSATSIVSGLPSNSLWKQSQPAQFFLWAFWSSKGMTLASKVYRKPTHTGQYLNFKSNYPSHVKSGLILSLHNTASTICQEWHDLFNEIGSWDVIFSSTVILNISLTRLLIPWVAVIWIKGKSLLALCIPHMWRVFQRS
jgi:hypothetical protein